MTKELKKILKSIEKWMKANNNNVAFIGSFVAFDDEKIENNEEDVIKEDRIFAYGGKDVLKIMTDEHRKMIKEENDDFVNW